jgi:hypothetical protein
MLPLQRVYRVISVLFVCLNCGWDVDMMMMMMMLMLSGGADARNDILDHITMALLVTPFVIGIIAFVVDKCATSPSSSSWSCMKVSKVGRGRSESRTHSSLSTFMNDDNGDLAQPLMIDDQISVLPPNQANNHSNFNNNNNQTNDNHGDSKRT